MKDLPAAANASALALRDGLSGKGLDPEQPLVWRRTVPRGSDFELRQGATVFGEMEPAYRAGWDATGECLGRSLDFRITSRFFRGVAVESQAPSGHHPGPGFRGPFHGLGRITTAVGDVLRWRHAWTGMYTHLLLDPDGVQLMRLYPTFFRFGRTETRVVLSASGWARPDLPDLILLTWLLRVHTETRGVRVFPKAVS